MKWKMKKWKIKNLTSKASSNTGANKTYIPVHKTNSQIISSHTTFLRKKINFAVHEENKRSPHIYYP